jgi:hypothetical protein
LLLSARSTCVTLESQENNGSSGISVGKFSRLTL